MPESVDVDDEIYAILSERADEKGFDTTDEYVQYVLGQVADKIERKHRDDDQDEQEFSKKDEEKVKKRLKNLGYLD